MRNVAYSWQEFDEAVITIARWLYPYRKGIKAIYGVPKGGLILAVALSHRLNKPLVLSDDFNKADNILVVDDICDTGNTLTKLASEAVYIATIHYVVGASILPDVWVATKLEGDWIVYPWEC